MKHCPICKSDDLYKSSSMPMRVVGALVLAILIPYGILLAWIPFIIPHAYICRRCGNETKEEALNSSDWREREIWIKKEEKRSVLLEPLKNQWIDDGVGPLLKVVYFNGIWIAYGYQQKEGKANVIEGYDEKEEKLRLGGEVQFPNVKSPSGVNVFLTDKELENLTMESQDDLKNYIQQEGMLHRIAAKRL